MRGGLFRAEEAETGEANPLMTVACAEIDRLRIVHSDLRPLFQQVVDQHQGRGVEEDEEPQAA